MIVRTCSPADGAAVNAVALAAFAQYENLYDDWDTLARSIGTMASLAADGEIIVAEDDARAIVGAVAYFGPAKGLRGEFFVGEWPIIRMLVVEPSARGKGIGRRLTEECIFRARRDGASVVALHTSSVMEVALSMYLRMGFRLERHMPDRFGVPYAVYVLELR